MRLPILSALALAVLASTQTGAQEPSQKPAAPPVLPLTLPGYELRVLDVAKPVVMRMNGTDVKGTVPIFVYYPSAGCLKAAPLARKAYDELLALSKKPEWSAQELHAVLSDLAAAVDALER